MRPQGGPEIQEAYSVGWDDGVRYAQARAEHTRTLMYALAVVLVAAVAAFGIWSWSKAASAGAEREQVLRLACVDEGGVWMPSPANGCVWSERAR